MGLCVITWPISSQTIAPIFCTSFYHYHHVLRVLLCSYLSIITDRKLQLKPNIYWAYSSMVCGCTSFTAKYCILYAWLSIKQSCMATKWDYCNERLRLPRISPFSNYHQWYSWLWNCSRLTGKELIFATRALLCYLVSWCRSILSTSFWVTAKPLIYVAYSWSSTDMRCSNHIWVINKFIAY